MKYLFVALILIIIAAIIGICYALSKPKKCQDTMPQPPLPESLKNIPLNQPRVFPPRDVSFDEEQYAYCLRYGTRMSNANPNPELRNQPIDFNNPTHIYIHPLGNKLDTTWCRYRNNKGRYIKKELADRISKTIYDGLGITTGLYQVNYLVIDGVFYITHHVKQPMLKGL